MKADKKRIRLPNHRRRALPEWRHKTRASQNERNWKASSTWDPLPPTNTNAAPLRSTRPHPGRRAVTLHRAVCWQKVPPPGAASLPWAKSRPQRPPDSPSHLMLTSRPRHCAPTAIFGRRKSGLLINFNAAPIKDGTSRIVNGPEEDSHAKSQGRQEHE
jgi:hypothetical protein